MKSLHINKESESRLKPFLVKMIDDKMIEIILPTQKQNIFSLFGSGYVGLGYTISMRSHLRDKKSNEPRIVLCNFKGNIGGWDSPLSRYTVNINCFQK